MNKLTFITGYSGCGKTTLIKQLTKYKDKDRCISLDELTKYYVKGITPKNKYVRQFVSFHPYKISYKDLNWNKDRYLIHNSFIKWMSTLQGDFYIEGIQFMKPYMDIDFISKYDIIIISTSAYKSMINRLHRWKESKKKHKLINLFKYDLSLDHLQEIQQMKRFKKNLRAKGLGV